LQLHILRPAERRTGLEWFGIESPRRHRLFRFSRRNRDQNR
jgi:hypothetical protein